MLLLFGLLVEEPIGYVGIPTKVQISFIFSKSPFDEDENKTLLPEQFPSATKYPIKNPYKYSIGASRDGTSFRFLLLFILTLPNAH